MRPQKVSEKELLAGLMSVLRSKGYDGASLNELAEAAGLQKASLYHRFPGGKKEIGTAVLGFTAEWTQTYIAEVLGSKKESPKNRLKKVLENINTLYASGKSTCIIRSLSLDDGMDIFGNELQNIVEVWIRSFHQLGIDFGMDSKVAEDLAINVFIKIQGSLIVSKIMANNNIFKTALSEIEENYLKQT